MRDETFNIEILPCVISGYESAQKVLDCAYREGNDFEKDSAMTLININSLLLILEILLVGHVDFNEITETFSSKNDCLAQVSQNIYSVEIYDGEPLALLEKAKSHINTYQTSIKPLLEESLKDLVLPFDFFELMDFSISSLQSVFYRSYINFLNDDNLHQTQHETYYKMLLCSTDNFFKILSNVKTTSLELSSVLTHIQTEISGLQKEILAVLPNSKSNGHDIRQSLKLFDNLINDNIKKPFCDYYEEFKRLNHIKINKTKNGGGSKT